MQRHFCKVYKRGTTKNTTKDFIDHICLGNFTSPNDMAHIIHAIKLFIYDFFKQHHDLISHSISKVIEQLYSHPLSFFQIIYNTTFFLFLH
ncbi:hypothetical protein GYH30_039515 [Glycine max]|uniref:Uncharacterized protein n=1 Tax=Glycine max TaxID=3847 RepID=A0A0R0GC20_SOYBN|nr:hypothetical protein GYH30_039515 [Glycine max]